MSGASAMQMAEPQRTPESAAREGENGSLHHPLELASGALALLLATGVLVLGRSADPETPLTIARAIVEAAAIVLPVAAGIYASRWWHTARFGRLLIDSGLALAPAALAMSSASLAYSIG